MDQQTEEAQAVGSRGMLQIHLRHRGPRGLQLLAKVIGQVQVHLGQSGGTFRHRLAWVDTLASAIVHVYSLSPHVTGPPCRYILYPFT